MPQRQSQRSVDRTLAAHNSIRSSLVPDDIRPKDRRLTRPHLTAPPHELHTTVYQINPPPKHPSDMRRTRPNVKLKKRTTVKIDRER
jgi:hypothetical protein